MGNNKGLSNRVLFFIVWLVCYGVIILAYCLQITGDDAISFENTIGLILTKTSAVILVQLGVMSAFFFKIDEEKMDKILQRNRFTSLAFTLSYIYIFLFVLLVLLAIYARLIPGNLIASNNTILAIMGILGILVNGPVVYLFSSKREEGQKDDEKNKNDKTE